MDFKEVFLNREFDSTQFSLLFEKKEYTRLSIEERNATWINRALCLHSLNKQFTVLVQGLGKIDIELLNNEDKYRDKDSYSLMSDPKQFIEKKLAFEHDVIISQLWVFGCYEILRTLTELFGNNGKQYRTVLKQTKAVKDVFERLRIPLAKFKPQRDNTNTDYGFGIPVHSIQSGIGWMINDQEVITRDYLVHLFLDLLKFLDENVKKVQNHKKKECRNV